MRRPPPPRPCHQRQTLAQQVGTYLLDWPLRRIGLGFALVFALVLLRPVIADVVRHCSPADWAACRSAR